MFRSGNFDFPIILTSQEPRTKFRFPAASLHCDAVIEMLRRDAVAVVALAFDANEDNHVVKSAVVSVKPIRVYLEGTN
jgi:hypothetical protein